MVSIVGAFEQSMNGEGKHLITGCGGQPGDLSGDRMFCILMVEHL